MTVPHKTPELSEELWRRISLVRRDVGTLLFHFTRTPDQRIVEVSTQAGRKISTLASARAVLRKILHEARLVGTGTWTGGERCVCFTEAPIHEFHAVFSLVAIASTRSERPRYEPYGVAVPKEWLFANGGRPVIYDHPRAYEALPPDQRYRFVPYNPEDGVDFTWEREWRLPGDSLELDPKHTLVIVPSAEEAFDIVYEFADLETDWDVEGASGPGVPVGSHHVARWLAVSLDLFGLTPQLANA
jgi:hypothetical protein